MAFKPSHLSTLISILFFQVIVIDQLLEYEQLCLALVLHHRSFVRSFRYAQLPRLYASVNMLVSASHGEGWGAIFCRLAAADRGSVLLTMIDRSSSVIVIRQVCRWPKRWRAACL
jgi:hypothetical protein